MSGQQSVAEFLHHELPRLDPGFRFNPVQVAYAGSISQSLAGGPGKLNFIEGDTGIGKTLAYLLTLADWVARGQQLGRHAVVSTHSRALQRQLLGEENQRILRAYLSWQGLPAVTLGLRMGKQNYVSPERLALALEADDLAEVATDNHRPQQERQIAQWALESDGCLLSLGDEELPEGVVPSDVALHESDALPDYLRAHFEEVQSADIQVVNHALLTMDLFTQYGITQTRAPAAWLLDEAEHFPGVAQQLLSRRISFGITRGILAQLGQEKASRVWRELFVSFRSPDKAGTAQAVTEEKIAPLIEGLKVILRARPRKSRLEDPSRRHDWERLRGEAHSVLEALEERSSLLALSYSPIQGLPSLALHKSAGGSILKSEAEERITLLTSATLSDLGHGPGEPPSFRYIRGELVLGAEDTRLGLERSHQALDFGEISFLLPNAPSGPLKKIDRHQFSLAPQYVRYAWDTIAEAPAGRTLVLSVSYDDVEALLAGCPDHIRHRVVTHGPGAPLNSLAEQLPDDGILITPAGWEGLSPARTGNEAFWRHVVLLRNPTPRPDPVAELTLTQHFLQRNSFPEASQLASKAMMSKSIVRAAHKIRQGLGRTIRHPDDVVMVTILDPRFPRPHGNVPTGVKVSHRLLGAIPFRFLSAYESAQVQINKQGAESEATSLIL